MSVIAPGLANFGTTSCVQRQKDLDRAPTIGFTMSEQEAKDICLNTLRRSQSLGHKQEELNQGTTKRERAAHFWQSQFARFDGAISLNHFSREPSSFRPQITELVTFPLETTTHSELISTTVELAWALLLACYDGSNQVVFGVQYIGLDRLSNSTATIFPVLCDLEPTRSVAESMRGLQKWKTQSAVHQHMGLDGIGRISNNASRACQFQTVLINQFGLLEQNSTACNEREVLKGVAAQSCTERPISIIYDLKDTSISVQVMYDEQSFAEVQVNRIVRQLRHIIQWIIKEPDQPIINTPSLCPEDCAELQQWNRQPPPKVNACMHELISQRCASQPRAPAICGWDGNISYGELDDLSSRLAIKLQRGGLRPGQFAAIYMEKTIWTPVAMLAVLKAGAAFYVMDISTPHNRVGQVCHELKPRVVLCTSGQAAKAAELAPTSVIVNADGASEWPEGVVEHSSQITPESLLYVVATSGSTGVPKIVMHTHSGFCTGALDFIQLTSMSSSSRVLQFSSYAFDVSISDILVPLLAGACVCTPSEEERVANLTRAITRMNVDWAEFVPSLARNINPQETPTLKTLALVGEPITRHDVELWSPYVRMINKYGPSEIGVIATTKVGLDASDPCNIGLRVGSRTWVVDANDHDRLLPIGATGELVSGGYSLSSGYMNNATLTAATYPCAPSWAHLFDYDGVIYKTGDLVQYTADGSLRFLGRRDTQVKIRGQRVELGEVEYYMRQLVPNLQSVVADVLTPPGVEQSYQVLLVFLCWTRDSRLDADAEMFVAPSSESRNQMKVLQSQLEQWLPTYMIPTVFIPLDYTVRTVSGKIDRKRLREGILAMSPEEFNAYYPISAIQIEANNSLVQQPTAQAKLLRSWIAETRNAPIEQIELRDSFVHLGGDSISAIRLSRLAFQRGFTLRLIDIMKEASINHLATKMIPREGINDLPRPSHQSTRLASDSQKLRCILGR